MIEDVGVLNRSCMGYIHLASSRFLLFLSTLVVLIAFAANSVLCRLALDTYATDPASFSILRLASGAGALLLIVSFLNRSRKSVLRASEWRASVFLAVYVLGFSFAYITLDAGIGALVLFSTVQLTMVVVALYEGERPHIIEWLGWLLAVTGIAVLTLPGASAPSAAGTLLMVIAGIAWAGYTLRGRGATRPLLGTAGNFVLATGIALLPCLLLLDLEHLPWQGVVLALVSGTMASAGGYAIWYAVLPQLSTVRAALLQLAVPVLAAVGGVLFIDEPITIRFAVASALVLWGIALASGYKERLKSLKKTI